MLDAHPQSVATARVTSQTLGMQQLCPHGLSEQWLLGACGDIHWTLLAKSLEQDGLRFKAADGRPLYAAFCATRLELAPSRSLLGENMSIHSDIAATSGPKTGSRHVFRHQGRVVGSLLMLSTFVAHDETGSNRRIVRALPSGSYTLPAAGPDLMALDRRARHTSRGLRGQYMPLDDADRIDPCYSLDFNAVGLLYFPSFSRFAESVVRCPKPLRMREVVYLGNLDAGEALYVQRSGAETHIAGADGRIIAQVNEERAS
ncbi:Pnap_2097 family protein [Pacificibacter marinus]|uniref:Pnap_2097 family protein n=1 Tax=Pacificibacter marinus TaxID=658057 RepID=UPI001C064D67|nr:Pnap_2097 family protein [Pacificibacter marinus]MBU2868365.1 hypothetical protein [Pacificibacter marinus]